MARKPLRKKILAVRVTAAELKRVHRCASAHGKDVATFIRDRLFAGEQSIDETPPETALEPLTTKEVRGALLGPAFARAA